MELFDGKKWIEYKPYGMMDKTGLTMEEIVLTLKREPDLHTYENGRRYDVYSVGSFFIRYLLWDPDFRERNI